MKTVIKMCKYFKDGEWVIFITAVELVVVGVTEATTDLLPEGNAKLGVLGAIAAIGAVLARARVWSARSIADA